MLTFKKSYALFRQCGWLFLITLWATGCSTQPDLVLRKIERLEKQANIADQDLVYLLEISSTEGNSFHGGRARGALSPKATIKLCYRVLDLRPSLKMTDRCFTNELLGIVANMKANQGIKEFSVPSTIGGILRGIPTDSQGLLTAWRTWLAELEKAEEQTKPRTEKGSAADIDVHVTSKPEISTSAS